MPLYNPGTIGVVSYTEKVTANSLLADFNVAINEFRTGDQWILVGYSTNLLTLVPKLTITGSENVTLTSSEYATIVTKRELTQITGTGIYPITAEPVFYSNSGADSGRTGFALVLIRQGVIFYVSGNFALVTSIAGFINGPIAVVEAGQTLNAVSLDPVPVCPPPVICPPCPPTTESRCITDPILIASYNTFLEKQLAKKDSGCGCGGNNEKIKDAIIQWELMETFCTLGNTALFDAEKAKFNKIISTENCCE